MRILKLLIVLLLAATAGCRKDEPEDPFVIENKVVPNNYLSANTYKKLTVEVQFVEGFAPSEQTIEHLRNFLSERLNKPDGISIVKKAIGSPGKSSFSIDDIMEVERESRTHHTGGKDLAAYVFFADAEYAGNSGNSKVLGAAYGKTSMAIFEKTVKDYSGTITQPPVTTLETTVLLHEFAHVFGLVNNGTPMTSPHQDEPHGKHCSNNACLMYYAAETTDIVANLVGGEIPVLDAKCIEDLRSNGGK